MGCYSIKTIIPIPPIFMHPKSQHNRKQIRLILILLVAHNTTHTAGVTSL